MAQSTYYEYQRKNTSLLAFDSCFLVLYTDLKGQVALSKLLVKTAKEGQDRYSRSCRTDLFFWPRGYKTFFLLNSTEHKISTTRENENAEKDGEFLAFKLSYLVFILLINVKMPTIIGILTLMSRIFMLS